MEASPGMRKRLVPPAPTVMSSKLRHLDFDDLFILQSLLHGQTIAATAKNLGLTQPAVSQRLRKIERVFGRKIVEKVGRHVQLTAEGEPICRMSLQALGIMFNLTHPETYSEIYVGVDELLEDHWISQSVIDARAQSTMVHRVLGSTEEMTSQFAKGYLDAYLTWKPYIGQDGLTHAPLGEIPLALVTSSKTEDIDPQTQSFIDLNESYPLWQTYVSSHGGLKFRDIWVLGNTGAALKAVVQGQGVCLLPLYMVAPYVQAGKMRLLQPDHAFLPLSLSLVYSKKNPFYENISKLAQIMKSLIP